jgi:hypothetical protein
MKRVAETERRIVRVPVVVEIVPVQNHLVVVLDEVRHTVVLNERIECHLFHHPLKFFWNSLGLNIISHNNAPALYTKYFHF